MRFFASLLFSLLCGVPSVAMPSDSETNTFQTPDGPVTTTTTTIAPVPQKVVIATPEQLRRVDALSARARRFVATYLPTVSDPSLKDMDEAFLLWQREKKRRYTEQQVIEILGAYLGSRLAADLDMEWVIVTDEYGTDYAVRSKKYEVTSFPFSSVAKRVEDKQHDFMVGVYYAVQRAIASADYKSR